MAGEVADGMTIPPLILAVETSGRVGSVAIALGSRVLGETQFSSPLRHSVEVFPSIQRLLNDFGHKPVQIEQVYISGGPGSFTGLRIATALAKTMHLANAAKIVTVDTLDVVAANVVNLTGKPSAADRQLPSAGCERIAAVLDAKRGQFFIAVYERTTAGGNTWRKALADSLMTIPQFLAQFAGRHKPVWLLGDGLVYYKDKFRGDGVHFFDEQYWSPRAHNVHLLGWEMARKDQFADPLALTPNYLRRPDVTLKQR